MFCSNYLIFHKYIFCYVVINELDGLKKGNHIAIKGNDPMQKFSLQENAR